MITIFNVRGYAGDDPLDRAPAPTRFLLAIAVSGILAWAFLYTESSVLRITTFPNEAVMWVGIAIYAFVMGPLLAAFRKSSSLLFYLMIVAVCVPTDIYLEARYRVNGMTGLWVYQPGTFLSSIPVPLKFFVAWSFDGLIQGPIALFLTRLVAAPFFPKSKSEPQPTPEQQSKLFPEEWTREVVAKPTRDAGFWILRLLGLGYLLYLLFCLIGVLGAQAWPGQAQQLIQMTYRNPALGINTFSKISLMVLLAFIGAYNRNVRWHTTLCMLIGHSASTIASLAFYLFVPPPLPALSIAPITDLQQPPDSYHAFLLTSACVDGAMVLIFAWLLTRHRKEARQFAPDRRFTDFLSPVDQISKLFFVALGIALALMIPCVALTRVLTNGSHGLGAVWGYPDPQICNTLTRYTTMSAIALLLANREKLRGYLTSVLIFGFGITLAGTGAFVLLGSITGEMGIRLRAGGLASVNWYFVLQILLDVLAISLLVGLRRMTYNVDYAINSLNPTSAQNVIALHEAIYAGSPVHDTTVLQRIDALVGGVRGRKRGLLNFPFWLVEHILSPLYGLHPTFSNMSPDEGAFFLKKYILRPPRERERAFIPAIASIAYKIGTSVHALITFAHYTNVAGWEEVGYVPPYARDRLQGDYASAPPPMKQPAPLPDGPASAANDKPAQPPTPHPLVAPRVSTPVFQPSIPDEVDYLIVGSGAGGACMAYRLACEVSDPTRILVTEIGHRYLPLQDFNDDEMEMICKLYKESGLQASKRYELLVLQGECVGGTTVINNAVCLQMPQSVRDLWQKDYGLNLSDLDDELDAQGRIVTPGEYNRIAQEIEISEIPDVAINQRVKQKFVQGVNELLKQGATLKPPETLHANQRNHIGDGLCNLGNKRLRKRSMLETYLPWAEARGVKIISDTTALCFTTDSSGKRAEAVLLRAADGSTRKVTVRKAVIASGGVIASSHFLMRSGVNKNVGQAMSCNFAFPVAFEFQDQLDAFDGVQITLATFDVQNRAAFETYFNPPGALALSLPFYFNRRWELMNRYRHLVNFGALVGSEPNGVIELAGDPISGRPFSWKLGDRDRENIKYAYGTLLDLGLAAGARRAVLPTEPGLDIPLTPGNVSSFKQAMAGYRFRMSDLRLSTAHPQGGNRMAGDKSPLRQTRVVDGDFRVDGFENVFVADASIFPTGITVNPQWTIMALSSMAAKKVIALTETKTAAASR